MHAAMIKSFIGIFEPASIVPDVMENVHLHRLQLKDGLVLRVYDPSCPHFGQVGRPPVVGQRRSISISRASSSCMRDAWTSDMFLMIQSPTIRRRRSLAKRSLWYLASNTGV
jgi:hypothetical protein